MDTSKVLYFLNMLSERTSGHSEEFADLYRRALDENDDIKLLRSIYENSTFYGELGRASSKSIEQKLRSVYIDAPHALDILPDIRLESEAMIHEVTRCDMLMRSPYPFNDSISVLRKNAVPGYMEALKSIAGACVYMILLYMGPDGIKYLNWEDSAGMREKLYAVNTKFIPAVLGLKMPGYYWVIRRRLTGGKALLAGPGYFMTQEPARKVEVFARTYQTEKIGTNAYLNIRSLGSDEFDIPVCWGTGNLTSVTPEKALYALGKPLVTDLRAPRRSEIAREMPAPAVLLHILSDGYHYCITPDELVKAMNQWEGGHEIEMRKAQGRCLFCGRQLRTRTLVCPEHFRI